MQHNEKIAISDESTLETNEANEANEANEVDEAATVIQKHIRRDSIERKYGIDDLKDNVVNDSSTLKKMT
jgi:hypothetical protein